MLDNSVIFPPHIVNKVNSTLPLRGQVAPATDTPVFVPVSVVLSESAPTTPAAVCACEHGETFIDPTIDYVRCMACGELLYEAVQS
jgi:hypothetical protein